MKKAIGSSLADVDFESGFLMPEGYNLLENEVSRSSMSLRLSLPVNYVKTVFSICKITQNMVCAKIYNQIVKIFDSM